MHEGGGVADDFVLERDPSVRCIVIEWHNKTIYLPYRLLLAHSSEIIDAIRTLQCIMHKPAVDLSGNHAEITMYELNLK